MNFKVLIIGLLFLVLLSLGSGLFFLVQDKGQSQRTVGALTFRIIISISLFVLLFWGFSRGWIAPHGLM